MAFCRNCGVQLNEREKFCSNCGASADGISSPQATLSVSIDAKKLEDGFLRIKAATIKLLKSPFKGTVEAHEILNPFASYLFALLLSLAYGLTGLWTKAAITKTFKDSLEDSEALEMIGYVVAAAFKFENGKTFRLVFLAALLSIAVIFGLLYLVSKVMLKQDQDTTTLLNAALFPFVLFLAISLVENIIMYISFKFYLILVFVSIIFLVVYLYHNISLVIVTSGEHSSAAYAAAVGFVCIVIVYNIVLLDNAAMQLTNNIQGMLSDLM